MVACLYVVLVSGVSAETTKVGRITWEYFVNDDGTATIVEGRPCSGAVEIPSSVGGYRVTAIDEEAFEDCRTLTAVTIPASVTSIGEQAFKDCWKLTSVTIPANVVYIGEEVFKECDALRSISVAADNSVYKSENGLLLSKDGRTLFEGVNGSVQIPDGVEKIVESAFVGRRNLTSVSLPKSVRDVEVAIFENCNSLKSIVVDSANANYKSENGLLLSKDGRTLFEGVNGQVKIPDGVETIAESAFNERVNLTSVSIPASVTAISKDVFKDCEKLTSVTFGGNAPIRWQEGDEGRLPRGCTIYVQRGSTGWGVSIPGTWNGFKIRYTTGDSTTDSSGGSSGSSSGGDSSAMTEDALLWNGNFHGVLGNCCTTENLGIRSFAMCDVVVSKGAKPSISAKVKIAGKSYSFNAKGWDEGNYGVCTLTRTWKRNGMTYEDKIHLTFENATDDSTSDEDTWRHTGVFAVLEQNILDVKSGVVHEVHLEGNLRRDNSKIHDYLDVARKFAGYYTVSLSPNDAAVGNGYLTLTIDNKGKTKIAGLLADGMFKPSVVCPSCKVCEDSDSANGWSMYVDIASSTAAVCFGGRLRLYAAEDDSNSDGSGIRIVVDSSNLLTWYDVSSVGCVAIYGDGKGISLAPCGGLYDKVLNLQRYYLDRALSVVTVDEFPADELPEGYAYVADVSPSGFGLVLSGDKIVYDKKKIVKTNKLTDFDLSVNVCNVSVKLVRATGLITGGFSLWSANEDGMKQKEVTGFKTYGVLLLARDSSAPLNDSVIAPGFVSKKVKKTTYDENNRKKNITWTFSAPFNIVGE